MRKIGIVISCLLLIASCQQVNENYAAEAQRADWTHQSMKRLTDVIVYDIFSPPVASRIYVYPSIAAYEALRHDHPDYATLAGQLTDLTAIPQPKAGQEYCFPLASIHALLRTSKAFIFSKEQISDFEQEIYAQFEALQMPKSVYERSLAYGATLSDHILAWATQDNYSQTRTFPKYAITEEEGRWKPTPPDYMDAIEPHWTKIRPFVLQSSEQFAPLPPTTYDMTIGSKFYQELLEVYEALDEQLEERTEIAKFWDCNPYVSHHKGHLMIASRKITPGGHWINIARTAAEQNQSDMMRSTATYAQVAIALADAFISCWDEKYRSKLIRPETVINEHLDEDWQPLLQTPPFPEHTSGHSVISRAAAVTLTDIYGDNFSYVDSTEVEYGLPPRSYTSFLQAAEEAAISRLYGGIHYRPAIDYGVVQGEEVGKYILGKLKVN